MTREEKCKLAIEMGYTYDLETGKIYSRFDREIKSKHTQGYIKIVSRKFGELLAHQFGWYFIHKEIVEEIDHINGVRDDNRIINLRAVTKQQNHFNRTKAKGYRYNYKWGKWTSKITLKGKQMYLGSFNTEEEAKEAYITAKQKYHVI